MNTNISKCTKTFRAHHPMHTQTRPEHTCSINQVDWPCLNPLLAALVAGASPPWSAAPSSPPSWTATCNRHGNRHKTHTYLRLHIMSSCRLLFMFDLKKQKITRICLPVLSHMAVMAAHFQLDGMKRSFMQSLWKYGKSQIADWTLHWAGIN